LIRVPNRHFAIRPRALRAALAERDGAQDRFQRQSGLHPKPKDIGAGAFGVRAGAAAL